MRSTNLSSVFYQPNIPPDDPALLPLFLREELVKIQYVVGLLAAGHLDKTYVAPTKPRDGDFRYADGTSWNPGSGEGFYGYYAAAWHFLG